MVDAIVRACQDAGSGHGDGFVLNGDVVRLVRLLLQDACPVWVRGADLAQFGRSETEHEHVREDGVWCEAVALAWWVILRDERLSGGMSGVCMVCGIIQMSNEPYITKQTQEGEHKRVIEWKTSIRLEPSGC